MRVFTESGVVMDGGIGVVIFIFGGVWACAAAKAIAPASATAAMCRSRFVIFVPLWLVGRSFHEFDLAWTPRLVEQHFQAGCNRRMKRVPAWKNKRARKYRTCFDGPTTVRTYSWQSKVGVSGTHYRIVGVTSP
jgi:hypothetical protein